MSTIVSILKNNKLPLMFLNDAEKDFLRDNIEHVERLASYGEWLSVRNPDLENKDGCVYRLSPSFEQSKAGWVEYDVYVSDSCYVCNVEHMDSTFFLDDLPSAVGYCGVMYAGSDEWCFELGHGLTKDKELTLYSKDIVKPATPIKARFWVER